LFLPVSSSVCPMHLPTMVASLQSPFARLTFSLHSLLPPLSLLSLILFRYPPPVSSRSPSYLISSPHSDQENSLGGLHVHSSSLASQVPYFHLSRTDIRKRYKSLHQFPPSHSSSRHTRTSKEYNSNVTTSDKSAVSTSVIGLVGNSQKGKGPSPFPTAIYYDPFEKGFTHYNVGVLLVSGTDSSFDLVKCSPAVDMALDIVNDVYLRPHKIKLHKVQRRLVLIKLCFFFCSFTAYL